MSTTCATEATTRCTLIFFCAHSRKNWATFSHCQPRFRIAPTPAKTTPSETMANMSPRAMSNLLSRTVLPAISRIS